MILSEWRPEIKKYRYWWSEISPERSQTNGRFVALIDALPWLPNGARRLGVGSRAVGVIVRSDINFEYSEIGAIPGQIEPQEKNKSMRKSPLFWAVIGGLVTYVVTK